jgi:uncharacterized protein YbbC (DUF1343 family)
MYYVATGLVGELAGLEVGCGGPAPFEIIAAKWLRAGEFTNYLSSLNMPGVSFSPYSQGGFEGSRIHIDPHANADLCALGVYMLTGLYRNSGNIFDKSRGEKLEMFYKCYGSQNIRTQIERGVSPSKIVAGWSAYLAQFAGERKPYLLY